MQGTPVYKKDVDTLIQRPRYLARPIQRDKKCPRHKAWAFAYLSSLDSSTARFPNVSD